MSNKIERPSRALYDAMVSAYRRLDRDNPKGVTTGTHVQVARLLDLPSALCRKAWNTGWPGVAKGRGVEGVPTYLPIKDLIFREQILARAKRNKTFKSLVDARTKALDEAVDDASESRALEGIAVRHGLMIASELQANTLQILSATDKLRQSIATALVEIGMDPSAPIAKRLAVLNTLSEIAERDSKTLERAQQLERRFMGEIESRSKIEVGTAGAPVTVESVYDDIMGLFRNVAGRVPAKSLPSGKDGLLISKKVPVKSGLDVEAEVVTEPAADQVNEE